MSLLFRAHFHTRNRIKSYNKNHFESSFDYANAFIIRLNDSLLSFFHFILWDALRTQNVAEMDIEGIWCRTIIIIVKIIKFPLQWQTVQVKKAKKNCLRRNAKRKRNINYSNKLMNYGFLIRCWGCSKVNNE